MSKQQWRSSENFLRLVAVAACCLLVACGDNPTAPPAATPTSAVAPTVTAVDEGPEATPTGAAAAQAEVRVEQGYTAPDFSLKRLDNGQMITLSELRGKAVWLNFWATWCEICQYEMPSIQAVYEKYADKPVVILGVNLHENPRMVTRYVEENEFGWVFAVDIGKRVSRMYHIIGQPYHVFIRPDGVIAHTVIGEMDQGQMEAYLDEMIATATTGRGE